MPPSCTSTSMHCTSQCSQQDQLSSHQLSAVSVWAHLLLFRSVLAQRKKSPLRSMELPPSSEVSEPLEPTAVIAVGCDAAGTCRSVWGATVMQLTMGAALEPGQAALLPEVKAVFNKVQCIRRCRCQLLSRQLQPHNKLSENQCCSMTCLRFKQGACHARPCMEAG